MKRKVWLTNMSKRIEGHNSPEEYRSAWDWIRYNHYIVTSPKASETMTVKELEAQDMVGVYRVEDDGQPFELQKETK